MLARLSSKAEQREKKKRAEDKRPAKHLEVDSHLGVILPSKARDLYDLGIVPVHVGPALPRYDTRLRVFHNVICPQRNGPQNLGNRNSHQAEVPATIGTGN